MLLGQANYNRLVLRVYFYSLIDTERWIFLYRFVITQILFVTYGRFVLQKINLLMSPPSGGLLYYDWGDRQLLSVQTNFLCIDIYEYVLLYTFVSGEKMNSENRKWCFWVVEWLGFNLSWALKIVLNTSGRINIFFYSLFWIKQLKKNVLCKIW